MVKLIAFLKRKPGTSADEFRRYWKEVHGPLVESVPEFMRHVRRYVQSHTISYTVPGVASPPSPFDGVGELWFDTLDDVARAYSEPQMVDVLLPDGLKFFDPAGSLFFVVEEIEFSGRPAQVGKGVKLMAALKRKPGMSAEEFHRYWKDVHGPLVLSVPEFMGYVRRYVQSHTISDAVPGVATPPAPYDGGAELWFDTLDDVAKAYGHPRFHEVLLPDGIKFFDVPNCLFFVLEELEFPA